MKHLKTIFICAANFVVPMVLIIEYCGLKNKNGITGWALMLLSVAFVMMFLDNLKQLLKKP